MVNSSIEPTDKFVSERISQTETINITKEIEVVFPLFGPIREKDWAYGWDPQHIYPKDVLVEEHMIFQTKSSNEHETHFTWMITQFNPAEYQIEYTVHTPNRIWSINLKCEAKNGKTDVTVTYTYTGLNELGNELNKKALASMFTGHLKDWEKAINHYLETGKALNELHH